MTAGGVVPMFAMERDPELTPEPTPGTDGNRRPAPTGTDGPEPTAPTGTDAQNRRAGTDGTDGPDTAPTVPGTSLVPVLAAPQRLGSAARLRLSVRTRIADAADYQRRHRTFWHAVTVFITRPPETWAETSEHLRSRKWLQEWMTGKLRDFCEWENVAWGHLVSMPAKAVLQNIEKVFFERQLGFWLGLGFTGSCALIWLLAS